MINHLPHQQGCSRMRGFEFRNRFAETFTQTAIVLWLVVCPGEHFLNVLGDAMKNFLLRGIRRFHLLQFSM